MNREMGERGRRLVIGLTVEPGFDVISGALVVLEGNGKYLRAVKTNSYSARIPETTRSILQNMQNQGEPSFLDLVAVRADLALIQNSLVTDMKMDAGKYIERLLVIALTDPGLRLKAETEQRFSICDPSMLAELSGISVVDDFPKRDLAAGGTGECLFALPAWLLFADRSHKIARKNKVLVVIRDQIFAIVLPASDGLDVDLPDIRVFETHGLRRLDQLVHSQSSRRSIAELNVEGKLVEDRATFDAWLLDSDQKADSNIRRLAVADQVRTGIVSIVERAKKNVVDNYGVSFIEEVILDCPEELVGTFVNQFDRALPDSQVRTDLAVQGKPGHLFAVMTAILGAMSVDQMPANVPELTGANSQRILGRLTPGSPMNWRQLVCEMADFQPPAMRLRDAV